MREKIMLHGQVEKWNYAVLVHRKWENGFFQSQIGHKKRAIAEPTFAIFAPYEKPKC